MFDPKILTGSLALCIATALLLAPEPAPAVEPGTGYFDGGQGDGWIGALNDPLNGILQGGNRRVPDIRRGGYQWPGHRFALPQFGVPGFGPAQNHGLDWAPFGFPQRHPQIDPHFFTPFPIDTPWAFPPLVTPERFFQNPGIRGYCGPLSVCGGDPTPAVPFNLHITPVALNAPSPQSGVSLANTGFAATVAIQSRGGELCSGVVVSDTTVLTAAHCVCDATPSTLWLGNAVVADQAFRSGYNQPRHLREDVAFYDPSYCETGSGVDLAAVFLLNDGAIPNAHFIAFTPTRPMPDYPSFSGTIVGFGASDLSNLGGVKRHATIQVQACTIAHERAGEGCVPGREWISISTVGVDSCKGDSGGPVYMHAADLTLRLVGLTSRQRGGAQVPFCGDGGIYTNLATLPIITWINSIK